MSNLGITPVDPATPVGQVRTNVGDTQFTPTATDGIGDYVLFSDAEITTALVGGSASVLRATGMLIKQLALRYTLTGVTIKTDDLAVDSSKRGATLLEIAQSWMDDADKADRGDNAMTFVSRPTDPHLLAAQCPPLRGRLGYWV